jgi:hypothetical protein
VFKDQITRTPLKTNNDLQNTTQKTKDQITCTPLKTNNDLQNTTQKTRLLFVFSGVRVT